jgi:uncharacterized protein (DUF488 family)
MTKPFYTIGHSTRSIAAFVQILQQVEVELVVDIRSIPKSRTNPQYNASTLAEHLAAVNIQYRHLAALGGLRNKSPDTATTVNGFWQNQSFHNYADYALTEPFQVGLQQLISLGECQTCTIMCAESVWWRCHRRIVADYLLAQGKTVLHLMLHEQIEPAKLTQGCQIQTNGVVTYPL